MRERKVDSKKVTLSTTRQGAMTSIPGIEEVKIIYKAKKGGLHL